MSGERITISMIQERVAEHYGMTVERMLAPCRKEEFVRARSVAMYLCRELAGHSFREIGASFARDHKGVARHIDNIRAWRIQRRPVAYDIEVIIDRIIPVIPIIHISMDTFRGDTSRTVGKTIDMTTSNAGRRYV